MGEGPILSVKEELAHVGGAKKKKNLPVCLA